ncbi:MAG: YheT family hydrolase [Chryseotalea sp.]|jgi:predicted alpha/beta-fold hydrolase|nr:alpha/beta fold hydrolase [Flammeovirgaceae bacterium]
MMDQTYKRPLFYFHHHIETIVPALFRNVILPVPYSRERITTPDDDFLDLDWLTQASEELIIISHGLEGSADRPYIKGMARAFYQIGKDVLAWNYRGCSGEMNKQKRFYHSGATDDLDVVVNHAIQKGYKKITLVGFSLGGNLTLKYLGESSRPSEIKKAIVFSVPLHLASSCASLASKSNYLYVLKFLRSLKAKVEEKGKIRNDIDLKPLASIKTLQDFDNEYTSKLHGYKDAIDYYESCSSLYFVKNITIPTWIVNAANDSFLSEACYPIDLLKNHPYVQLIIPKQGGHVGFTQFNAKGLFWSEEKALHFYMN